MNLRYYTKTQTGSVARYNGNMAEWEWQQGSQPRNLYSFTYDKLSRLTTTNRWAGGTANNSYTERDIVYNRNGDITALKRYGTTATVIDNNLSYTYTANKLSQLQDASSVYTYAHDANGNITSDGRRGYNISYNVLNLPKEVKQSGTIKATYTYLADGTKAGVVDNAGNGNDYLGSLIYTRSGGSLTLESAAFGSGRIYRNGSSFDVQYYSTDHLGSTRAITNSAGTVIEQNDYYPFGLKHNNSALTTSAANRFRFSGKEEQTKFATNFNYLDFGARSSLIS